MQESVSQVASLTAELTRQRGQIDAAEAARAVAAAQEVPVANGAETGSDDLTQLITTLARETQRTRTYDLSRLGRTCVFDPTSSDWHDWEFTFLSYLGVVDETTVISS